MAITYRGYVSEASANNARSDLRRRGWECSEPFQEKDGKWSFKSEKDRDYDAKKNFGYNI
jgi:hypothetical protein